MVRVVLDGGVEIEDAFRRFRNLVAGSGHGRRSGFIDSEVFAQRGDKLLRENMGNIMSIEIAKVAMESINLEPHRLLQTLPQGAEQFATPEVRYSLLSLTS